MEITLKLPTNHTLDGERVEYPKPKFVIGDAVCFDADVVDDADGSIYVVVGMKIHAYGWEHAPARLASFPGWWYQLQTDIGQGLITDAIEVAEEDLMGVSSNE
jgi:hypothetical protein